MSQITVEKLDSGWLYILPLPPSTNARTRPIFRGGRPMEILTKEARQYLEAVGTELRLLVQSKHIPCVYKYERIQFWFILPRTNSDNHNFFKVLWRKTVLSEIVTFAKKLSQ